MKPQKSLAALITKLAAVKALRCTTGVGLKGAGSFLKCRTNAFSGSDGEDLNNAQGVVRNTRCVFLLLLKA